MKILLSDNPDNNSYIESLINAYSRAGYVVNTGANDFFFTESAPDILHIHWPESLQVWNAPKGMGREDVYQMMAERLAWYKNQGATIINTIHNLAPHDTIDGEDRDAYKLVIEFADILVHHCSDSIKLLAERYPTARWKTNIVCPHGDYLIDFNFVARDEARRNYGIPKNRLVILNFGRQRPYKNEHFITTVFNRLALESKYLVIAGVFQYPANSYWLRIRNRLRKSYPYHNRKYIYRLFPRIEIPNIISAADIIFLGQMSALNSGLTALAATYSKPVVCPDIGCFKQSLDSWHHETYAAGNVEDAARALLRMCNRLPVIATKDNSEWLRKHSWDNHVAGILKALPG
jgi:hypothetical protein